MHARPLARTWRYWADHLGEFFDAHFAPVHGSAGRLGAYLYTDRENPLFTSGLARFRFSEELHPDYYRADRRLTPRYLGEQWREALGLFRTVIFEGEGGDELHPRLFRLVDRLRRWLRRALHNAYELQTQFVRALPMMLPIQTRIANTNRARQRRISVEEQRRRRVQQVLGKRSS